MPRRIRVILQSRTTSSRLPGKALLPLGGLPVFALCAKRLQSTGIHVVLATSDQDSDDVLTKCAAELSIDTFRGSLDDVLSRFIDCTTDLSENDILVRMTADNPFPDGEFVQKLVNVFLESNQFYLGTLSPSDGLPYGLSGEVFTVAALREAHSMSVSITDREHVTPYLRRKAGASGVLKNGILINHDLSFLRCTIDTLDDYLSMVKIFDKVENPVELSWKTLVSMLEKNKQNTNKNNVVNNFKDITLGSAQFGSSYGIVNHTGCPPNNNELQKIILKSSKVGITYIDTARTYGNAEERIGKLLAEFSLDNFRVITKLEPLINEQGIAVDNKVITKLIEASVFRSCYELKRQFIDVMMLHRFDDMFSGDGFVLEKLSDLVKKGVIGELGVSVYTPEEAMRAILDPRIRHVQIPFNILDSRWISEEFQDALKERDDVKIHVRSVFLQGLLVNDYSQWPDWVNESKSIVSKISQLCIDFDRTSAVDLCVAYVRSFPWVSTMVVGVDSSRHLEELLCQVVDKPLSSLEVKKVQSIFDGLISGRLLDPRQW